MSLNLYSKESVDSLLSAKIDDAPSDGNQYVRKNATWSILSGGGGGGATWGTITGSITDQTDLISYFGNYLPLAGGTMTGGLTVASAGITFSDASVMTTAPTAFNGGTVNSTVAVTDGTNTTSLTATGITFADSTVQSTAFIANTFLPLSGGTMTGSLTLGGDMSLGGYNLTDGNFNAPAGQVNCQNLTLTAGDGGSVTFADGSVQTTAASAGLDATSVANIGICATLFSWYYGVNYYTSPPQFYFNDGWLPSVSPITFSNAFYNWITSSGQIGVWDGYNFCPLDGYSNSGGSNGSQYFTASSAATATSYILSYKDGSGTWHTTPFTLS
jgi:hypothetical protein